MLLNIFKKIIIWFLELPGNPLKNAIRDVFYGEVVTERIVEYALLFSNLGREPSTKIKILDVGCYYSNFPIQLASMGYKVTGLDMQDYELTHPNFKFIRGDVNKLRLKKNSYDVITCVSTLEHIGLGPYGDEINNRGDINAVNVFDSLLKKGGGLMVTVPYGVKAEDSFRRVYNGRAIVGIFKNFKIKKTMYFAKKKDKWIKVAKRIADKIRSKDKIRAIIFIYATKK